MKCKNLRNEPKQSGNEVLNGFCSMNQCLLGIRAKTQQPSTVQFAAAAASWIQHKSHHCWNIFVLSDYQCQTITAECKQLDIITYITINTTVAIYVG